METGGPGKAVPIPNKLTERESRQDCCISSARIGLPG